jgi:hypothetical protein
MVMIQLEENVTGEDPSSKEREVAAKKDERRVKERRYFKI